MTIKQRLLYVINIGLIWTIISLGMVLRIHNGDYFPIYQNDDSPFYVWLGNSILDDFSHPSSLTIFEQDNPTLFWRSQYKDFDPVNRFGLRLTDKYFDHPFLGGLIMALPARYFGFTGFSQIPQMLVRMPALLAALLTLVLTYYLTTKIAGKAIGLTALAILAFWPTAILAQRQGYLENLITPLFLLALIGIHHYSRSEKHLWLFLAILSGMAAAWIKLAGYVVLSTLAYWLTSFKKLKAARMVFVALLLSLLLYVAYGFFIGGTQFFWTIDQQQGRGTYLTSVFNFVRSSKIQGEMEDGWWYIGMLGLWFAAFTRYPNRFIGISGLWWLMAAYFLSGPQNTSPWYIYPVYPFMAIGAAMMLNTGINKHFLPTLFTLLMLAFTGYQTAGIDVPSGLIRLLLLSGGLASFVYLVLPPTYRIKAAQYILIGLLLVSFYGNTLALFKAKSNACGNGGCVQPDKIILERNEK